MSADLRALGWTWARRVAGLVAVLPAPLKRSVRWMAFGGRSLACPVCGRSARMFLPAGRDGRRSGALCPWCGSLERHRLVWLYLQRATDFFQRPARILHFSPEPGLTRAFAHVPGLTVVSVELEPRGVDVANDATALAFRDEVFDLVYCSHVLEHVWDDRAAMREIRRVLRPGGSALIQVPTRHGPTFENSSITDPCGRLEAFGQEDHVRYYGDDFAARLAAEGFEVTTVTARELVGSEDVRRFALIPDEPLFRCDLDG